MKYGYLIMMKYNIPIKTEQHWGSEVLVNLALVDLSHYPTKGSPLWLSGKVYGSWPVDPGFEPHRIPWVFSWEILGQNIL